ncbi:MAG: large conductance mechanosensitive channel protein MscL [Eubacteriales bacterium]
MKELIKEFKEFAVKGNVMDLAVAVVIGAAFGKIVTSLVNDIVMPLIGVILGGRNFSALSFTIGDAQIKYGSFLQSIVDFSIIALTIFLIIKFINRFKSKVSNLTKGEEEASEPQVDTVEVEVVEVREEIKILTEIRDLLKKS